MAVSLLVKNLSKYFDHTTFFIDDISFSCEKGQIVGLIGENGAGKTTILNAVAGLDEDIHDIWFNQIQVDNNFFKTKVGFLPERLNLYDYLSIKENIQFVSRVRNLKLKQEKLDTLLKKLNLYDYYDTSIRNLSKGMRKKFEFIITIIHSPDLLLLDEPFDGLDPKQMIVMKEILNELSVSGKTILVSSHAISIVKDISSKILFINNGKLKHEINITAEHTVQDLENLFYD
ncbi:ABC transporter, ATP-binding protein [Marinilactibacillus psychrotolerans 42ea]|uniref:ABC transporter, ATP-binding protein n=1 Tax=Marinilactibacillus psychrotolerans 42ea TaxID=1255609 RepID=A0A1R4K2L7_9LACT|nr:ABC transporter ATP-binding protein [Marinilactibacillus psychrotolerans]SJN38468.1 ABC transporter, ATP-binding protein [Marinilactibacillus psychrotolerans 42ea]